MKKSPPLSEPERSAHLWLVLMKAHHSIHQLDLESIASSGLCFSDFATLEALKTKRPLAINTIGEKVHLSSGAITTAVDRLEKKGLVTRQNTESDRRVRLVHLTPAGETLIDSVLNQHFDALQQATAGLSAAEKEQLINLLKKLGTHAASLAQNAKLQTI